MAKKNKVRKISASQHETLLEEVQQHLQDSSNWLETRRGEWDDLESILIAELQDDLSNTTKSKVYDPRLSTIVFERASRVMAQNPKGKAYAQSKDDVGKNILMNLLLGYFEKNANEQFSFLTKLRMWDLYSLVYGTMFALVPWRVNKKTGYIGPEVLILPIRDCFPQPNIRNLDDASWFTVRNVVGLDWLKAQDQDVWQNIDRLEQSLLDSGGDKDIDAKKRSFVQRKYYPGEHSDSVFPKVELYTEYRRDKWVTWTPGQIDRKTSRPFILRVLDEPYPGYRLPIVAKHAFPLIDSPIGLGEFARGKTLQFAINSLWNLYLDGVKYSIFPPVHVNADNVVPSSIKWGSGEFWFMNNPNQDVQAMDMSPQGMNTFHNTFGALTSAIETQAGTSSVREAGNSKSTLGKTPEAIRFISERESARDEWDRVMMEEALQGMYDRWIDLIVNKMDVDVEIRLFGEEIEDIKKVHPDIVEIFESGKRGKVKFNKKLVEADYDFELETGSTFKPNIEEEQNNITAILKAVLENPQIIEALQMQGKQVDIAELFKRWVIAGGVKDYDKIIIETPERSIMPGQEQVVPPQMQEMPVEQTEQAIPVSQEIPVDSSSFQDPDIAAVAEQFLGGIRSIPTQQ